MIAAAALLSSLTAAILALVSPPLTLAWAAFLALVAFVITPILLVFCIRLLQSISILKRNTEVIRRAAEELRRNAAVSTQLAQTSRLVDEALNAADGLRSRAAAFERALPPASGGRR